MSDTDLDMSGLVNTTDQSDEGTLRDINGTHVFTFANATQRIAKWESVHMTRLFFALAIMVGFLCIVGMILNALAIAVLSRQKRSLPSSILLLGLAASDFCLLLFTISLESELLICSDTLYKHIYTQNYECDPEVSYRLWINIFFPTYNVFYTCGIYFVLATAIERFLAIKKPFAFLTSGQNRRHSHIVLIIFCLGVLVTLPRYVEDRFPDPLWYWYRRIYVFGFNWTIRYIIPLPCLLIFNIKLLQTVQNAKKDHCTRTCLSPDTTKQSLKSTHNVIAVVTCFLCCQTPVLVLDLYKGFANIEESTKDIIFQSVLLLISLNSAVNFIIYFMYLDKFKKATKQLCGKSHAGRIS